MSASVIASKLAPTASSFSSGPTISAPPVIHAKDNAVDAGEKGAGDGVVGEEQAMGRKIFRPPAMTLDQGEGFAGSGRKRGAPGGGGGGKKKKWRKVCLPSSFPFLSFPFLSCGVLSGC